MQPLTRQRLAANAYRTLGVSASAGQAAIESAARRLRIWADPARLPPTPWDVPSLGPLSRSRTDIDHAVARLSEPASRLEDRLLWYQGQPPLIQHDGAGAAGSIADRHDAAVAALHAAAACTTPDIADWQRAVALFNELATTPDYLEWLARVESEGQFDKRSSRAEMEAAVESLPGAIVAALVPHAQAALDTHDSAALSAVLALVREDHSTQVADAIRRLADGLEDLLDSRCRQMDAALRDKLRTNHSAPQPYYAANHTASDDAALFYSQNIVPVLERLGMVLAGDTAAMARANSRVSEVLTLLALGWEWSGKFVLAQRSLERALELADGPSARETIEKDLARVRPRAEEERRGVLAPSPSPPPRVPRWMSRHPGRGWHPLARAAVIPLMIIVVVTLGALLDNDKNSRPQGLESPLDSPLGGLVGRPPADGAPGRSAEATPPDPASLPRDVVDSVGEVNREP